jgi:molybdate transport system substrate-binding protein
MASRTQLRFDFGRDEFRVFDFCQFVAREYSQNSFMKKLPLLAFAVVLAGCGAPSTPTASQQNVVRVSAAASLKNVLTAIGEEYSGAKVQFNFASSGTLQRQIENGAPVDILISAADTNMDELENAKLIDASMRGVLARNRLVLIVPKNSKLQIRSFNDLKRPEVHNVAIGAPQSVPAGKYTQQVLQKIGIWKTVEQKAVRGKDVREVLTQVERGNVEAGIVYLTDAAISSRVKIVCAAPEKYHAPIRYPFALVKDSQNKNAARKFVDFLSSESAKKILRRYRFRVE